MFDLEIVGQLDILSLAIWGSRVSIPLVGSSTELAAIERRLDAIARAERTTLISGPTGSGKDVIARSLHERSRRSAAPLIVVHCAALPDNLIEAELFGHAKGAFTGAYQARSGLVRSAEHGSLFLDEIDSLSLAAQAKLLRFLETGEFRAVGADHAERSDAWVIAATNQELRARVRDRTFREDLLYRLEALTVRVPALRERRDEIEPLAALFLRNAISRWGAPPRTLSESVLQALVAYAWPGNVRQLRNAIERAVAVCTSDLIELDDLPEHLSEAARNEVLPFVAPLGPSAASLPDQVRAFEMARIRAALVHASGNRSQAARLLGLPRRTLGSKLREYNLE